MKNKLLILLALFIVSCSEEIQEIPEPIVEDPPKEDTFEYKTYKRITRLSNIESDLLKKHNDLDGATREIMNIYDNSKGTPQANSDTQE
tara:strand:- start:524 stop:790 length:267 start_codon:yes stop_codon:yes gene_type:complete